MKNPTHYLIVMCLVSLGLILGCDTNEFTNESLGYDAANAVNEPGENSLNYNLQPDDCTCNEDGQWYIPMYFASGLSSETMVELCTNMRGNGASAPSHTNNYTAPPSCNG